VTALFNTTRNTQVGQDSGIPTAPVSCLSRLHPSAENTVLLFQL